MKLPADRINRCMEEMLTCFSENQAQNRLNELLDEQIEALLVKLENMSARISPQHAARLLRLKDSQLTPEGKQIRGDEVEKLKEEMELR